MTIIEGTTGTYRSRVDGTLVLQVEIEPRHAQAALSLFSMPGTPMALAALKTAAQQEPEPEKPVRAKGGLLSQWAALRCQEPAFQTWISRTYSGEWNMCEGTPTERAAEVLRHVCEIDSRAELDNDDAAAELFHTAIRGPWQKQHAAMAA